MSRSAQRLSPSHKHGSGGVAHRDAARRVTASSRPGARSAFALAVGVAIVLGISAVAGPAEAQRAAKVGVDAVRVETVSQTVPVIGRLVARRAGPVAARVAAAVSEVRVDVGDRVEAGDVLAVQVQDRMKWTLELRKADLAEATAQLESAGSQMNMIGQEVKRLETLRKNRSAAFQQARYDDKRLEVTMLQSRVAEASARVAQARANMNLARIALKETEIRAPFAGVVTLRHTEAGAFLNAGSNVVTLVATGSLEAEADVPAERVVGLKPGIEVAVRVGETVGRATVRAVVPEENSLTRTRAVRFTLHSEVEAEELAANQSVRVEVPIGAAAEALTVHKDAVLNRNGGSLVFVVTEGAATPRPVNLGDAVGNRFVVIGGLKEGELVVVRGNERLRPGQPVSH